MAAALCIAALLLGAMAGAASLPGPLPGIEPVPGEHGSSALALSATPLPDPQPGSLLVAAFAGPPPLPGLSAAGTSPSSAAATSPAAAAAGNCPCRDTPPSSGDCLQQRDAGQWQAACTALAALAVLVDSAACADVRPTALPCSNAAWMIAVDACALTCGRCAAPCAGQCQCTDVPPDSRFNCSQQARLEGACMPARRGHALIPARPRCPHPAPLLFHTQHRRGGESVQRCG